MSFLKTVGGYLPEVKKPEGKLPFKTRITWTLGVLMLFFLLGIIPVFGVSSSAATAFEQLELLLGASIGSIITLGIGPIVTASIVLQLLNGAGFVNFQTHTEAGRRDFATVQKLLTFFFIVFEAAIFTFFGVVSADPTAVNFRFMQFVIIIQLFLGAMAIVFMDEIITKWGFGSGVSLFIAAGVSKEIFIRAFSPLRQTVEGVAAGEGYIGRFWELFRTLSVGDTIGAALAASALIATIVVFLVVVYVQAMKVEIPLSFGRVRGHGIRWPLQFFYTSNMPVILVAALLANIALMSRLLSARMGWSWIGVFPPGAGSATGGLAFYLQPHRILELGLQGALTWHVMLAALTYTIFLTLGSALFSFFWVQTVGLDARSQAKKIMSSGLQVPGFRNDSRVLESILGRYIMPLTIMGGLSVGLLAAAADLSGTLSSGTGLLLAVMIIYQLYEAIAREQMYDLNPAVRKFLGKN
jgi:preprotein translocase subunit SecY